jgi:hypothetical protein
MPGQMIGIVDALGYFIVMGTLFFPVFWFLGYFFSSLIRVLWQDQSFPTDLVTRSSEQEPKTKPIEDHDDQEPPIQIKLG